MSDLVVGLEGAPGSLDPHKSNNLYSHAVLWSICEPLFDVRPDGTKDPVVAERLEKHDDLTYTVHLRPGLKFHDGQPCDGEAIVKNLRAAARADSFRGRILRDLIDVDAIKYSGTAVTIPLRYEKVDLLFLALMISPASFGTDQPFGTGPFRLPKEQTKDQIVLEAVNYRGRKPKLRSITFKTIPPGSVATSLASGDVHFVRVVDPTGLPMILENPQLKTRTTHPLGTYYLGFNLRSALFGKKEVRQAVRAAIDLEKIEYHTGLEPAAGPIPPNVEAYDPPFPRAAHDPVRARAVLGPAARGLTVPLLFNRDSWYARIMAHDIKEDLAEAGVTVKLEGFSGHTKLADEIKKRKEHDEPYLFIANWYSILPAAEIFLRPLFEGNVPENLSGYAGVDDILAAARKPMSSAKRIELYRQAVQKILDEVAAIFLGHPRVRMSAHSARVRGLDDLNVQSFPVDRFLGVDVG